MINIYNLKVSNQDFTPEDPLRQKKISGTALCSTGFVKELTKQSGTMHAEETGEEPSSTSEP